MEKDAKEAGVTGDWTEMARDCVAWRSNATEDVTLGCASFCKLDIV